MSQAGTVAKVAGAATATVGLLVAVIGIPIKYNEWRRSQHEADVAELRRKAEEEDAKWRQQPTPSTVPTAPKVTPVNEPPAVVQEKKAETRVVSPAPITPMQAAPVAKAEVEIPALVSLSAFEEGSLEILEGKHKGKRLPVAASLRNNFKKDIIGPSGDVRFRHPDGGTKVFDVYFARDGGRVVTGDSKCDTFECRWLPAGYPK
jgi:hypothetical protein